MSDSIIIGTDDTKNRSVINFIDNACNDMNTVIKGKEINYNTYEICIENKCSYQIHIEPITEHLKKSAIIKKFGNVKYCF